MSKCKQIDIKYNGSKLRVKFDYTIGRGFIDYETPPEEDEVNIISIESLDGSEIPANDLETTWDIERIIKEKITD